MFKERYGVVNRYRVLINERFILYHSTYCQIAFLDDFQHVTHNLRKKFQLCDLCLIWFHPGYLTVGCVDFSGLLQQIKVVKANGGTRHFLYQFHKPAGPPVVAKADGSNTLGKLEIMWRTTLGEAGRLQTQQILGNVSTYLTSVSCIKPTVWLCVFYMIIT